MLNEQDKTALFAKLESLARRMRVRAVRLGFEAGANGAHFGGGLSCIEIMAVLYGSILKYDAGHPEWKERDRFLVSKAHCVLAYYTALCEAGFLSEECLSSFEKPGSPLVGHPQHNTDTGMEYSGGSLGMAFSVGLGMAVHAKRKGLDYGVYVLLGDGECDEGSNWEAFMAAPHFGLNNVTVIIDQNRLQYDGPTDSVMNLAPLSQKLAAFGWDVHEVDGHSVCELFHALSAKSSGPKAVIADTVKGKGISFM